MDLPTPNFETGRRGARPLGVVVHTTEGSFEGAAAWFASPESGVSAHYLVGLDGRVARLVDEADTARHAGRVDRPTSELATQGDPNLVTIGIEFEDGGEPLRAQRSDAQYRAGARLLRGISLRWGIALDREHVIGHREVFAAKDCPGNLDVERLLAEARELPAIVGLLPARDAEHDLAAWLDGAWRFCDAVVALDDGSSDRTRELLEVSPLVTELLSNPARASAAGWHDGRNRTRLLEAAAALEPDWIVQLDADELLDPEDAAALRELLEHEALPSCAYGLRHFRMWGEALCDPRFAYMYRVFHWRAGLTLPDERLHLNPVPLEIERAAWIQTSIRVRHYGAADESRVAARLAKYREADPQGEYGTGFGGLHEPPDEERLVPWERRPAGMGALDLGERRDGRRRARLVCLLPARNAEAELSGWLESVRRFADAVVALDDGSSDRTRELLEAEPLVTKVLANPRREGYEGWDDAANRARLLEAAAELEPDWVMQLDSDERIDPEDAAALRRFVDEQAEPGFAYGFKVFRMTVGLEAYDRAGLWAYRLFAFERGQRLPEERLHFVPVPESIPRERYVKTTFRIQHLGSGDEQRRRARFAKYREADPGREFQSDYAALLDRPGTPRPWQPRPEGFPALADPLGQGEELDLESLELDAPVLSAVVIARNDEDRIERAVRSVVEQECPLPFEVIVVVSGDDRTAQIVREHFPQVRLVELEGQALPGRARNAGVAVASGEYVSFPGSHVELPPGSLAARLRAHEEGHSMVTGVLANGTDTPAGWASYLLDNSHSLPGRPAGRLNGPPARCSYRRDILLEHGGFPEDMRAGEDTVVNLALYRRGYDAYRSNEVRLTHYSRCSTPARLARHHFQRGLALGRIMRDEGRPGRFRTFVVKYLSRRLRQTRRNVELFGGDELRRRYRRVYPLVLLGAVAAWAGTCVGLVRRA